MFKCVPDKMISLKKNYSYKFIPDYSPANRHKFKQRLLQCQLLLDIKIENTNHINQQYDFFIQVLQSLFEFSFPLRKIKTNRHNLPWVNDTIRLCIRKRDHFYRMKNVPKFKHYRSKVKSLLFNAKKKFICDVSKLSDRESWNKIKSLGNFQLKNESQVKISFDALLDQFNSIKKPKNLPFEKDLLLAPDNKISISESDVMQSLKKIKKGGGFPHIPAWIIKNYYSYFVKPLHLIFSESVNHCFVPDSMKMATITPIPKTKTPKTAADYRPITSSSPFLKCFETILLKKWFEPLVTDDLFSDQFAFVPLKGRGCTPALICIYGHSVHLLDQGNFVNVALVDFSKAFDRACKTRVIDSLLAAGASQQCARWTFSFLSDRRVNVKLNGEVSSFISLDVGTPQGSKLSPLLFAFLCSSLKNTSSTCKYIKYADDLTIIHCSKNSDFDDLFTELNHIKDWCFKNNMLINVSKTKILHISGRKKRSPPIINLMGQTIEVVKSAKLLGLVIQDNLKWNEQVEQAIKKASKIFYTILRLKKAGCNEYVLQHFYKSVVRPHMTYASPVTCNMTHYNLNRLYKAEKRFNKIIGSVNPTLADFCNKCSAKLVNQVKINSSHPIRQLLLPIQKTRTRQSRTLYIPKGTSALFMNSFIRYFK